MSDGQIASNYHHHAHGRHLEGSDHSGHRAHHDSLVHQTQKRENHASEAEDRHKREAETAEKLHKVHLTDIERDKHILADGHAQKTERLQAAHELLANHIKNVEYTDEHGHHRKLDLERGPVDGRLRVSEGGQVVMEDNAGRSYTDHLRAPGHVQGMHYLGRHFNGVGSYHQPEGGHRIYSPHVDPRYYNMVQNPDGSRTIEFNGCQVDTDGAGSHPEDRYWQSHTCLRLANGESLNTDLDNFVVLSPSLARATGAKLGDCGYLVDKATGRSVPVVFGDSGPEGKRSAEASVHAIKQLGRNERIDGNHGLEGRFQVVVVPHSGNGRGDMARNPDRIKEVLDARGW